MKHKIFFIILLSFYLLNPNISFTQVDKTSTRMHWLQEMDKMARPVFENLANDQLKENMPVELAPECDDPIERTKVAYLEAFGRSLCGIAPWLQLEGGSPYEIKLRNQYREWTLLCIKNAVDPKANDYMKWTGGQPLVDAAFFAQGLIKCPWLWENLDQSTKIQVITALLKTRDFTPYYSNWLLFSGMIEAFFCKYDLPYDAMRIDYGIKEFANHWYTGDGMFADGNDFALDYYNSYVIQPFLNDILDAVKGKDNSWEWFREELGRISARYALIQERSINIDGTFPAFGRSIVYRAGAFTHLANEALYDRLPEELTQAQVRCALTAVLEKTHGAPGTYSDEGWLQIGLYGHQPHLANFYSNTGSLYLTAPVFLPLGLPENHPFWNTPDEEWTSKKIWTGKDVLYDHSYKR